MIGGNLFDAAGFPDADDLQIKQEAVEQLRLRITEAGLSQADLARQAGLEPSHVSEILAGRLNRFSIERLNRALAVFGLSIEVRYRLVDRKAA